MKHLQCKIFMILLLTLTGLNLFGQDLTDMNINYMLSGQIYAGSSIKDFNALGGFGGSKLLPKKITAEQAFNSEAFYLKIDTAKTITYAQKYNGYKLFIVNKSDSTVALNASDSRLYVVAEAFVKEEWQAIEYLTSSWCGNSYHQVFIKSDEYWDFNIPKFSGKLKAKMRYRLKLPDGTFIYSNEVNTKINKKQLTERKRDNSRKIVDPSVK